MKIEGSFIVKPWLKHWFLWVGILSIISLNLIGLLYVYWYVKMRSNPNYAPASIVVVHAVLVLMVMILAIAFVGQSLNPHTAIRVFHYTWHNPPTYIIASVSAIIIIVAAIPFAGLRYNQRAA